MKERIYILLPVHNRVETTRRFIKCLKEQTYTNYHLVLIDDGSTDGTSEMIRDEIPDATIITGKGKWWWGGSLQQGYLWLKEQPLSPNDYILIMNDDTEFFPDFLLTGLDVMGEKDRTILIAACYSRNTKKFVESGAYHYDFKTFNFNQTSKIEDVNCLSTRGLLIRVKDFINSQGFHPKLLPHYLSDIEFTMRTIRKRISPLIDSRFKLFIDEGKTGYRPTYEDSFLSVARNYFSKKSIHNPLYFTSFVILASPWPWKPVNIIKIFLDRFFAVCRFLFFSLKKKLSIKTL